MAVRKPLYNNSGNLQEMSTTMVNEVVDQIVYQYSLNPSVSLSVVSSGGTLGTITDTRLQAGSSSTNVSSFPGEGTTAEPSIVTINYAKISQTKSTVTPTADDGKTWPVFLDSSNNIQAMNLQDVKDTFLHPAIDLLVSGSLTTQQGGTYHISSSTSVTGSTEVSGSNTAVYSDSRANTSAYTSAGIPETQDQPTTISNYYLQKITGSDTTYTLPIKIRADNDLQVFPETDFESLLQEWIRYTAASSTDGYTIDFSYSTGTNRGTGMADTRLNGSGNYQTRFINANDYRAQEFPNGSPTTIATHFLKIGKS
tara:strand:- start:4210 stop:5142 length:933 start_codon:yes stop_codon:yes gene_type:complete